MCLKEIDFEGIKFRVLPVRQQNWNFILPINELAETLRISQRTLERYIESPDLEYGHHWMYWRDVNYDNNHDNFVVVRNQWNIRSNRIFFSRAGAIRAGMLLNNDLGIRFRDLLENLQLDLEDGLILPHPDSRTAQTLLSPNQQEEYRHHFSSTSIIPIGDITSLAEARQFLQTMLITLNNLETMQKQQEETKQEVTEIKDLLDDEEFRAKKHSDLQEKIHELVPKLTLVSQKSKKAIYPVVYGQLKQYLRYTNYSNLPIHKVKEGIGLLNKWLSNPLEFWQKATS